MLSMNPCANVDKRCASADRQPGDRMKNFARLDARQNSPRAFGWTLGLVNRFQRRTHSFAGSLDKRDETLKNLSQ